MKKVLVVDDRPDTLFCHERILSSAGFDPITADDPVDALIVLAKDKFHAILTDYSMPGATPEYFLALLASKLPVLLVTSLRNPTVPPGIEIFYKWEHHNRFISRLKFLLAESV